MGWQEETFGQVFIRIQTLRPQSLNKQLNLSIIHINTYLICNDFYHHLYNCLQDFGIEQKVWIPHQKKIVSPKIRPIKNLDFKYSGIQNIFDRILFHRKINKGKRVFFNEINYNEISLVHAHTLFSDGALAFELYREKNIPFIVAVRDTDLNIFWKYFFHLRSYARDILLHSSAIVFLGPAYKQAISILVGKSLWQNIHSKTYVIPNGIDCFWINNPPLRDNCSPERINVLFAGNIIKRKNISSLIQACSLLLKKGHDISLRIVGAKKPSHYFLKNDKEWIDVFPFTKSKNELMAHYRWADIFATPSITETFGLVYAEALSQGTPVIYTKNQGFDGWVEQGTCGYSVDPKDIRDIAYGILHLKHNYDFFKCIKTSDLFNWNKISRQYLDLYRSIV